MKTRRSHLWSALVACTLARGLAIAEPTVEIRAVEGMRFDPPRMSLAPGVAVTVSFQNADATDQMHNIVVGKPGQTKAILEAALALGAEGPDHDFVPQHDAVLAASKLIKAGERELLPLDVPKAPGIYPYVCTFPGHGVLMFGAFYVGEPMPADAAKDPNIPHIEGMPDAAAPPKFAPDPRPTVRRFFMPDAGPAAIAVALPDQLNACWDAGLCLFRYAWTGGFIDGEAYFRSKGSAAAKLLGPIAWTAADGGDLSFGAGPDAPKFLGYRLKGGLPTFEYRRNGVTVKESIRSRPDAGKSVLIREFECGFPAGAAPQVTFQPPAAPNVTVTSPTPHAAGPPWRFEGDAARHFTLEFTVPAPTRP